MTEAMPSHRLAYDDASTPQEMSADCRAAGKNLRLERAVGENLRLQKAAKAAVQPAPSIHFEDYPREVTKREIRISDAATRIANALQLHLD